MSRKEFVDKWREVLQWACIVLWVERGLIPASAELNASMIVFMIAMPVACVTVKPVIMKPVIPLKQIVVFDDPVVLFTDIGRQKCRRDLRMIGRRKDIANIVK